MAIEMAAALAVLGVVAVTAALRLFAAPLKLALKVTGNALLGFLALLAVNFAGEVTGVTLGLNVGNALVIGVLGVPGLGLLLLLRWVFV